MKLTQTLIFIGLSIFSFSLFAAPNPSPDKMPGDFVYLKAIDPSILQDIRYSTHHNFVGRPIKGYEANECMLTKQAASALSKVQAELTKSNLSLKVYDCYRPQRAVDDFVAWSKSADNDKMKQEFYPRVAKAELFKLGYVASHSGHTRGSTVDLTIVPIPTLQQANYHQGQTLVSCFADYKTRYKDNSIDMGTGYDCLDSLSHYSNPRVSLVALQNRKLLSHLMEKYGFEPYDQEWWHFTLRNEPYPKSYFNFPIAAK